METHVCFSIFFLPTENKTFSKLLSFYLDGMSLQRDRKWDSWRREETYNTHAPPFSILCSSLILSTFKRSLTFISFFSVFFEVYSPIDQFFIDIFLSFLLLSNFIFLLTFLLQFIFFKFFLYLLSLFFQ